MIVNTRDEALVQLGILAGKARWISAKTKVRDGYEEYFNPNCEITKGLPFVELDEHKVWYKG